MEKPYVIAEIGINHDGKLRNVINLINLAKKAGADAVKFQLFQADTLAKKNDLKKYKLFKKKPNQTLYEMWKSLMLKKEWLKKIKNHTNKLNIDLGFSIFDDESLNLIKKINIKFIKVASSDLTDHNLLKKISKMKKRIIMSTGMAEKKEINQSLKIFNKNKITLLHCVSLYPTKHNLLNLKRMEQLKKICKSVGFSDHSVGVIGSIKAINLGASIIEKHFTYNKNADGPDHKGSADYNDLKIICDYAKKNYLMEGSGRIKPSKNELRMRIFARKSIFAKNNIKKGEKFSIENIECRRPGNGLEAQNYFKILGKKSIKNFNKNEMIKI